MNPRESSYPYPAPMTRAEWWLRQEWWVNHGCNPVLLYGDDGELQCNAATCRMDFKREPIESLRAFVLQRRRDVFIATGDSLVPRL